MKTWVKLYTETNRDPKIGTLTWAQRGIWAALLALAGELDDLDAGQPTGMVGTEEDIAWRIRCDVGELEEALELFRKRDMVHREYVSLTPHTEPGDLCVWYITHFQKRQERAPSETPQAVTARVKRHREKQAAPLQKDVTDCNESVTACNGLRAEAEPEAEQEADTEQETEAAADTEQSARGALLPAAADPDSGNGHHDLSVECGICLGKVARRADVLGLKPKRAKQVCLERGPRFAAAWVAEIESRMRLDRQEPLADGRQRVQNAAGLLVEMVRTGSDPPEPPYSSWVWEVCCATGECLPVCEEEA